MKSYDDRPHHPQCPANPDSPYYEEEYVDADRVHVARCRCDSLEADDYDREMDRRIDQEREEGGEG